MTKPTVSPSSQNSYLAATQSTANIPSNIELQDGLVTIRAEEERLLKFQLESTLQH